MNIMAYPVTSGVTTDLNLESEFPLTFTRLEKCSRLNSGVHSKLLTRSAIKVNQLILVGFVFGFGMIIPDNGDVILVIQTYCSMSLVC